MARQYANHDFADFAQEFLRRNPDYRADYAATLARMAARPSAALEEQEGLSRRWGLSFPQQPQVRSPSGSRALVTRRCA
ncbi:hypothetical protein I2488_11825 [Novosphingobium sp. 1Y9A]|uniref:Transcriptional regulator-like domain-containing protein n=2 Tax=Novosphingobium jiangmenense TaxID=2791981 RepID=A0ABS0HHQ3_9SPHN|nr:hypothetical protein [Novosphingobium jiangmenense]